MAVRLTVDAVAAQVVTEELQWSAAGVEEVPVTSQPLQQRRWPQDPPTRGVYSLQPSRIESFTWVLALRAFLAPV